MPDEHHSTSNDDDFYRDMPDLLTDDEETDDEESVYQSYVGRSTHQNYLTLVEWQCLTRGRGIHHVHHYGLPSDFITITGSQLSAAHPLVIKLGSRELTK